MNIEERRGEKGRGNVSICRFHTRDKYSSIRGSGNGDLYDESYRGVRACYTYEGSLLNRGNRRRS